FDAVNPSANFPNLIDFDSDGDLDLICGEQYGRFFYYKNTNLSVSNSMQTCVGGEAVVKLKVVSNEEKGIYTITNAFTGSIGSEGVLGAAEKLTPDITILGTYVLEVTANDGCAQVAAVVEVDDIIPTVVDIQSIDINTCTNPFTASFNPVENAIAYQVELTLPALNNRIITKKIIETNLETNIRLPRRLVGKEILVRIAPIFEEDGIEEICDYSEQRSFVIGCDEENAITLEERSKEAQLSDFIDEQSVLSIFPIPASNQLYYQVDQMEDVRAIYLFDVHGRIVQEEKVLDGVMDISHLPNGKYTLVLESAQRRVHRLVQKF
ncbi:MAG: T9SS type A sorting domain-containing protein, partial [Bacteroidota bacterium]